MLHETQKAGQTPIAVGTTTVPPYTKVDAKIPIITVNIFFDGTRNNLYNSAVHRADKTKDGIEPSRDCRRPKTLRQYHYEKQTILN